MKLKKPTAAERASRKDSDRCALCRTAIVWIVRDGRTILFDVERGDDHRNSCSHQRCWGRLRKWAKDPRFLKVILEDEQTALDVIAKDASIMAALAARKR